jgi:hypothetical protein
MTSRTRIRGMLALALALSALLVPVSPACADRAYESVAAAFTRGGGHLDPCAFTRTQLEAALRGIPAEFRTAVPDLRRAIHVGIAAHERGDCKGVRPEEGTTGGAAAGTTPPVTTAPSAPAPPAAQTAPATSVPTGTTPTTAAPATTAPTQPAATGSRKRDRTPLLVALVAAGALVLLALLLWGAARTRGWDPAWAARVRHGWSEAGFRTTSTWAEFTDWLRLGR